MRKGSGKNYVVYTIRLLPEQREYLRTLVNASEVIRGLIDDYRAANKPRRKREKEVK